MNAVNSAAGAVNLYGCGIPVRNLWLLMLYASDLFRSLGHGKMAVEENPDEIPDLVAELLAHEVERRLRRNLTFGYRRKDAVLNRVRGRIDLLTTERRQLLARGQIACRFDNLTVNTPRNRFVRAALAVIAQLVRRPELARRCNLLAGNLQRMGVSSERPSRSEMSCEQLGRKDADDQRMLSAAQLAFDLALPTETAGRVATALPDRDIVWLRNLYEKAVGGFYEVVLASEGWQVETGKTIHWPISAKSSGIDAILPSMRTDIILDHESDKRRIVIDTKFTSILTRGWHREATLRSGYIYQIYAYLRSQEAIGDNLSLNASGLLLHPSVDETVDESVTIQGHAVRFATVDLSGSSISIREQLIHRVSC